MNIEHFHNQLALRLGYDNIVNNKGIAIKVEYDNPNDPRIEIDLPEGVTERFYASEEPSVVIARLPQIDCSGADMMKLDIEKIIEATHQTYLNCLNDGFSIFPSLEDTAARQLYKKSL